MQELLKTLFIGVLTAGGITIGWFIVSGLLHLLFYTIGLWKRITWKIHLKKHPKYLTKVDPIYKLEQGEWDSSMYVEKWELGYAMKENVQFWLILIPFPIEIYYYQYNRVGSFRACERDKVVEFGVQYTLEEFWDQRQREADVEEAERMQRKNAIEQLNKVFEENYE